VPKKDAFNAPFPQSALSPLALSDRQPTAVISGVRLPLCTQQSSGRDVRVLVTARNEFGGESWSVSAPVELSSPTFAALAAQMLDGNSTHVNGTSETPLGGGGTSFVMSAMMNQSLALLSSMSVDVDAPGSSSSSNVSSVASSSSMLRDIVDTASSIVMLLDVIACGSRDCGAGMCVVTSVGPVCDCAGTGFTGEFCNARNESTPPGVVNATATATPGPASSAQSTAVSPAPLEKQCRSSGEAECSGHGVCERSRSPCLAAALDCTAACR
jgi:hypothetical protein